jgi:N-acetylglucosamine kinase-like BadF-type ATPase
MTPPVVVGVDNGGTWIRMIGLDAKRRKVWSLKKPSPTIPNLPTFLKKHLHRFHGSLQGLAVGSRAIWAQGKRKSLKRALYGIANHVEVMSDVEAAWVAAFKTRGILVISGTGSIAYGRTSDGQFARAGGLGPQKGDEGSGYWIGKEWGKRQGVKRERIQNVRQIASLAPLVIRKAKNRHPIAQDIIKEAEAHLADLVRDVAGKLRWKKRVPLSVSGSVLGNEWFRRGFLHQVKEKRIPFQFRPRALDVAHSLAISELAAGIFCLSIPQCR